MPPEKKPEAKPASLSFFSHPDPFVEFVWTALSILVILYLVNALLSAIFSGNIYSYGVGGPILKAISDLFWAVLPFLEYLLALLSVLLIAFSVCLYRKLKELRQAEAKLLYPESSEKIENINTQWKRVLDHIESGNESDWRLAILEADIMLGGLLDKLSLTGETMADKLKTVERSDFTTIDNAWEAHKVRNQIAHEGQTFMLSQHEAKRVVALYETIFEEFQII